MANTQQENWETCFNQDNWDNFKHKNNFQELSHLYSFGQYFHSNLRNQEQYHIPKSGQRDFIGEKNAEHYRNWNVPS